MLNLSVLRSSLKRRRIHRYKIRIETSSLHRSHDVSLSSTPIRQIRLCAARCSPVSTLYGEPSIHVFHIVQRVARDGWRLTFPSIEPVTHIPYWRSIHQAPDHGTFIARLYDLVTTLSRQTTPSVTWLRDVYLVMVCTLFDKLRCRSIDSHRKYIAKS